MKPRTKLTKIKYLKSGKTAGIIAVLQYAFEPTFTINGDCKRCNKGRGKNEG